MIARLFLACAVLCFAESALAGVIGIYDFSSSLPSGDGSLIADYVPNILPGGTTSPIRRMINGASYEDANAFGISTIGTNLGRAGLVFEPTSGSNNFAFWLRKDNVMDLPNWSILYWVNRRDLGSDDYLFYVGVSDGRGGASAETSIYSSPGGLLRVENFTSSSGDSRDMLFEGGSLGAGTWHQLGLVREGNSFSLFLDGELVGNDPSTAFNSFNVSSNTVMVLGGYKSGTNYKRMLDGMIDQVEVYDEALTQSQIVERYNAIATVPEANSLVLLAAAIVGCSAYLYRRL